MIDIQRLALQLAVAAPLTALGSPAVAQSKPKTPDHAPVFSFNGVGTHSCGVYLANMKGFQADIYKDMYQQWGAGFMAGASNQARGANPHTDLETYTAWLDKWCADDPVSNVALGVIALGKRLATQK